jgi:hypothetical protein
MYLWQEWFFYQFVPFYYQAIFTIYYINSLIVKWHKLVKKSIYKCRENEIVDLWLFDTKFFIYGYMFLFICLYFVTHIYIYVCVMDWCRLCAVLCNFFYQFMFMFIYLYVPLKNGDKDDPASSVLSSILYHRSRKFYQ